MVTDNRIGLTVADQSKYLQLTDLTRRGADQKSTNFLVNSNSFSIALDKRAFGYIDYLAQVCKCFDIIEPDVFGNFINNQNLLPGTRAVFKNYFLNNVYLINLSIRRLNIELFKVLSENKVALSLNHKDAKFYEELYGLCKNDRDIQLYFEAEITKDQTLFSYAICNRNIFIISLFAKNNIVITNTYYGILIDIVLNGKLHVEEALNMYLVRTAKINNPLLHLIDANKDEFHDKVITAVNESVHCLVSLVMVASFFSYVVSKLNKASVISYTELSDQKSSAPSSFFSTREVMDIKAAYIEKIKILQLVYVNVLGCIRNLVVDKNECIDDYSNIIKSIEYTKNPPKNQALLNFCVAPDDGETECRKKANDYIREISVGLEQPESKKRSSL